MNMNEQCFDSQGFITCSFEASGVALASLLVLVGVTFACRKENGDKLTFEWLWKTVRVACLSIYRSFKYSMSETRARSSAWRWRLRYQKCIFCEDNACLSNPRRSLDGLALPRPHKELPGRDRSEHVSHIESAFVLWRWRRPTRALSQHITTPNAQASLVSSHYAANKRLPQSDMSKGLI